MNYYNEFDPKTAAWLRELIKAGAIPDGHVDERSIADVSPSDLKGYVQCHFFAGIGGWSLALQLAGWPETNPCGQEVAPASHSPKEEIHLDTTTQEICGTFSTTLYQRSNLNSCLANKLKERLNLDGSTDYKQTWRQITTPAGVSLWEHTARLYHTQDSDFSGLPTPAVNAILEKSCPKEDGRVRYLPSGRVRKSSKKGKEGSMNWSQDVLLRGYLPTPKLCLFLMGYPEEWWESGERAMQSFPKSRRSSSDPSLKQ